MSETARSHMAERAARWVDEVFPWVAVRQWVLTVPWPRRWLLARRPVLARGALGIGLREIGRWYRRVCGQPGGRTGSITAIQRFGSALNLNVHFHALVLDGVYAGNPSEAPLAPRPIPDDGRSRGPGGPDRGQGRGLARAAGLRPRGRRGGRPRGRGRMGRRR